MIELFTILAIALFMDGIFNFRSIFATCED